MDAAEAVQRGLTAHQIVVAGQALPPETTAHLLAGALRGFKLVAKDSAELRTMLHDLVALVLPNGP